MFKSISIRSFSNYCSSSRIYASSALIIDVYCHCTVGRSFRRRHADRKYNFGFVVVVLIDQLTDSHSKKRKENYFIAGKYKLRSPTQLTSPSTESDLNIPYYCLLEYYILVAITNLHVENSVYPKKISSLSSYESSPFFTEQL